MRVFTAGAWASAGPKRAAAPTPSAAAPAAMKLRRSGLAGAEQQAQVGKNFRADRMGYSPLHGATPRALNSLWAPDWRKLFLDIRKIRNSVLLVSLWRGREWTRASGRGYPCCPCPQKPARRSPRPRRRRPPAYLSPFGEPPP